ncbi:MAG: hypothetical protein O3A10_08565 [Chloroflexi bacterium]|nr:hypothetical protein [Chloroflexota bacterium]MDA1146534.1 hypothetical protein [Chloroflexota bacterium]MQC82776.1 hypothetical protein [Chloroflexota bacterium]PKB56738.1 MAG: hypothetical protein BZY69_00025 [SAR202 cluster bacterium Casp-Chloro-G1]
MNVVLNSDESHVALTLVSALLLDNIDLSEEGRRLVREWRRQRDPGNRELDEFTVFLNERLGNHIDERTTRMMRVKGKRKVSQAERWQ